MGLDRLEQAVGDLVVCFEEGYLEIDDMTETTDTAEAAHVTTHRVHLTLRRSEWNLAENAAAAAVALVSRDTVTGLTRALNLLHKLAACRVRLPPRKGTQSQRFSPISGAAPRPSAAM